MLYRNTVHKDTLELLEALNSLSELRSFFLVGGTALSLQIGHRISVDLDFFTTNDFDENELSELLIEKFNATISNLKPNTVSGNINGVKFDFISHQYPLLDSVSIIDSIRLASLKDIAAMKTNAIINRGSKKDFVDLYFLIQKFGIREIFNLTQIKYPNYTDFLALKSLIYYKNADTQPNCNLLIPIPWEDIKAFIEKEASKL